MLDELPLRLTLASIMTIETVVLSPIVMAKTVMPSPGADSERRPVQEPSDAHTSQLHASEAEPQGTPGMSAQELRCQGPIGCVEVVDRLAAADRSAREGFDDVARQLRDTASMFWELHHVDDRREAEQ